MSSSCDEPSASASKSLKKSRYVHPLTINLTATFSSRKMPCNAFLTRCCAIRAKVIQFSLKLYMRSRAVSLGKAL